MASCVVGSMKVSRHLALCAQINYLSSCGYRDFMSADLPPSVRPSYHTLYHTGASLFTTRGDKLTEATRRSSSTLTRTLRPPNASVDSSVSLISQDNCALCDTWPWQQAAILAGTPSRWILGSSKCRVPRQTPHLKVQALRSPRRRLAHTTARWAFEASWKSVRSCPEGHPDHDR